MTAVPDTTPPAGPRARAALAATFLVAMAGAWAFQAPHDRIGRYLYNDAGADLVAPTLLARGLRPTIDFGYIYGLLPLELNRLRAAWGGPWATSARGLAVLTACAAAAMALGLARFAASARVGAVGLAVLLLAVPDLIQVYGIALVHAIEPAVLVHALASQARGRRGAALALATADLFVKPAMAYVYGASLLAAGRPEAPGGWRRVLAPPAVVGLALAAWLGLAYGPRPLLATLWPGAGAAVYRENGYGFFFGAGRDFWLIPGGTLRDYLRYEVGGWLAGTAVLAAGGLAALRRRLRRDGGPGAPADEVVLTCALLHVAFVTLFYGQRLSWVYYYALLACGLAAMTGPGRPRWQPAAVGLVAALMLVGSVAKTRETARLWRAAAPIAEGPLRGAWATPQEREEWRAVLRLAAGRGPAALLARTEGAAALEPETFLPPETLYLVPGHPTAAEVARKATQIEAANTLVRVRPRGDPARGGFERWPPIARALDGFEVVWEGEFYEVSRRAP